MNRFGRFLAAAGIAMAALGGAAMRPAQAQHVVTESEAGKLSFDALTAAPAHRYVREAQYYHHRRYLPPPRRHHHYPPPRHRYHRRY